MHGAGRRGFISFNVNSSLWCMPRLTCSLLLASFPAFFAFFDLRFAAHICCVRVSAVSLHGNVPMSFSAERCLNQAVGVAVLFHLPHCLFHHFINSALNSS